MRDFSILSAVVDDLKDIQTCADTVTTVPDCTICQQTEKKTEARWSPAASVESVILISGQALKC
jgi:hypothetical protein